MTIGRARAGEAAAIAALRTAANEALTARYGKGHWSGIVTERFVRFRMRNERVFVGRWRGKVVATFALAGKKPWSIDRAYFTPVAKPLYLIDMAVDPARQGKGLGRKCVEEAVRLCRAWPADAVYLDAWDAPAGAGGFYRRCGFRPAGRAVYRGAPLAYYERLVRSPSDPGKVRPPAGLRRPPRGY